MLQFTRYKILYILLLILFYNNRNEYLLLQQSNNIDRLILIHLYEAKMAVMVLINVLKIISQIEKVMHRTVWIIGDPRYQYCTIHHNYILTSNIRKYFMIKLLFTARISHALNGKYGIDHRLIVLHEY